MNSQRSCELVYDKEKAVEPLVGLLKDNIAGIRERAVFALNKIAKKAVDKKSLQPAIKPLIAAMKDEDNFVRSRAAMALMVMAMPSNC